MDSIAYNLPEQPASQLPRTPGIYRILNTVNGHCYIGSTINLYTRKCEHLRTLRRGKHSNIHLQRAYSIYGEAAFEFQILEHINVTSLLLEREQFFIDMLKPEYNLRTIAAGSNLGMHFSEETRRKVSLAQKGKIMSPETRAKISAAHKGRVSPTMGRPHSESTKAKLSAANRGKVRSPEARARNGEIHRGQVFSEETRRKMSEDRKGHPGTPHTEETKKKLSELRKGKKLSPEHIRKAADGHRGKPAWNKGATQTPETRAKMSATHTGSTWSPLRRARFEAKKKVQQSSVSQDTEDTA